MAAAEMTDQKKTDQKQKALDTALTQIERAYGKGSIMRMGDDGFAQKIEAIPTGALNLDAAIGIGGIPRGRISEIFGPESSGKTTICLHIIANAQRLGGIAAFIDAEHALDVGYARKLGVDVDNLLVSQPDTGEQALEIAERIHTGPVNGALDRKPPVGKAPALQPPVERTGAAFGIRTGIDSADRRKSRNVPVAVFARQ